MSLSLVYSAHRAQKAALNLLGLKIQVVVSCHVGAGNQVWVLCQEQVL